MVCVGIDVAKDKHDCCILDSDGMVRADCFTIPNNMDGFKQLLQTIRNCTKKSDKIKVGLEATGHYSYNILGFLLDNDLAVYVMNPLHTNLYRKSLSLRKTKTDRVDARTIATMLLSDVDLKSYTDTAYHNEELFPEFAQKPVDSIKKVDCDWVLEQIEIGGARCRTHAVINQRGLEMKKESCPKLAKRCDCGAKTIEKAFRSETVDIKTAEQVAIALGCKVDDAFDVETIAKPMTRKSMREYALFIRSTLEYADENYGVKNPMHKIPALGSRSRSVDTIKKHQIKQLQDTLKESSMLEQVIVLSLLNSGVRRGELAGLTWKDVNFEECTIHISKSLLVFKDFGYQLTTTKESNIRDVDVAPEYMDFLKEYYKYWKSQKKLMGGSWQKSLDKKSSKYAPSLLALRGTDFVICNDHGFPINPDSYGALVRRIGQRAGIEGLHPHMFRHTFVSILLSNPNIGVATVAAEAGHAQPSTTLAIYTQVYDRRRDEIRKQMSRELYKDKF